MAGVVVCCYDTTEGGKRRADSAGEKRNVIPEICAHHQKTRNGFPQLGQMSSFILSVFVLRCKDIVVVCKVLPFRDCLLVIKRWSILRVLVRSI